MLNGRGLLLGLNVAWQHGFEQVWVEMDSSVVVDLMQNGFEDRHHQEMKAHKVNRHGRLLDNNKRANLGFL